MAIDGECSRCKRSFSNLTEHINNVHKLVKDASHKKSYKPTKSMVGKSGTVRISAIAAGNVAVVGEVRLLLVRSTVGRLLLVRSAVGRLLLPTRKGKDEKRQKTKGKDEKRKFLRKNLG